ncbi:hypothetical protein NQ314_013513 [Rhamnusium bicolor]|uniref:Cytochrome P450 n=1 Tax=Rhamnusium bicolor TaxID=1586634 RepID=A0AAV8X5I0_9CUCU|nr:hypothetical protein NQ314_013513 [Rhamnusium bicolor]
MKEENIDKVDMNRIVVDLILGAGDTTTYTMEWMLYLISKNKDVQQELRQGDRTLLKKCAKRNVKTLPGCPIFN